MEYREIVAVTGLGGLFHLLTTKSDGAIVRNLEDKSTKFISARLHNVTPIETIEVYTTGENVRLQEVFKSMLANEVSIPPVDPKSADNNSIKAYFKSVLPEFDEERVYVSDMKKMLKWYKLLKANDLLKFEEPQEEPTTEETAKADDSVANAEEVKVAEAEPVAAEQPVKKTRSKKSAETVATEGEEKPAKKTASKKTKE
jgi:hypothetical protein